jgi:hypothetical protein
LLLYKKVKMIIHLIEFIAIFTAVSIVQPYFFKGLEMLFKKKAINISDELLLILDESEPIEGYLNEALDNPYRYKVTIYLSPNVRSN